MKKLLLFVALVGMSFYVVGQSFSLSDANGPIEPNSTVYIIGDPVPGIPLAAHIYVTNNAGETKTVLVKKVIQEGDTIPGTLNYFCSEVFCDFFRSVWFCFFSEVRGF